MPAPQTSSSTRDKTLRLSVREQREADDAPAPRRARAPEQPAGAATTEPVVDLVRLTELLRFPLGSLRRHASLAWTSFLAIFATALLAAVFLPRTYEVETRILARRSMVLPALGNPRRTVPTESDAPARLAVEAVMSRESLTGIIKQNNLLAVLPDVISPLSLIKENVRAMIKGPRSERDQIDALVKLLEKRMIVAADNDKEGTVSIGIRWRDPATALSIVQTAQKSFLDKRYEQEVSLVKESIGILERYVLQANQSIATSMADLRRLPGVRADKGGAATIAAASKTTARSREITAEMARAQASLTSIRGALSQQEAAYTQRVSTAQAKLADLESKFGPAHPEVAASRKAYETASIEPSAMVTLRTQEQRLVGQLAQLGAAVPGSTDAGAELAMQRLNFERLMRERADSLEDPRVTYARSQLKIATTNYEDMLDRLEAARIELETAGAAFKYRYTIISPAQYPKQPAAPNVLVLIIGGLVCAGLAALFATTARDVLGGRVVEKWQISRQLGLPLLGEIHRT